jgi:hypothetical protein
VAPLLAENGDDTTASPEAHDHRNRRCGGGARRRSRPVARGSLAAGACSGSSEQGRAAIDRDRDDAAARRREAIRRTRGALTGDFEPDYVERLRADWPA